MVEELAKIHELVGELRRQQAEELPYVALNRLAKHLYDVAKSKGWHSTDTESDATFLPRALMNLHGEVSELWEAYRKGALEAQCDKQGCDLTNLEEELADVVIRALDVAQALSVDIGKAVELKDRYNQTRAFRHGGKLA